MAIANFRWAALLVCLTMVSNATRGDVFHYKDGRVISGTVTPTSKAPLWTVEIEPGTFVQVHESELLLHAQGHEKLSDDRKLYAQGIEQLKQTAQAHCEMAVECEKRGMADLKLAHYRAALDLDPENATARSVAGYKKDENGRWVKKEEIYGDQRGKVQYNGRWRFPESIAIEQAEEEANLRIAPLKKQLGTWHQNASAGRSDKLTQQAIEGFSLVQDPMAVGIIAEYLLNTRRPAPAELRLVYVRVISQFKTFDAAQALAAASLHDPETQIRNACLDALRSFGQEVAVPMFVNSLRSSNNELVNRAAEGLGQFSPPQAVLPLIEALVTQHVQEANAGSQMNASLNGGLSFGGGAKKQTVSLQNPSVYGTLAQITGQSFDYDENRWMAWYASVFANPMEDLRRDR